jgi:carbamoyl-phosphate synthase small subunit
LVLADGTEFVGEGFGALDAEAVCEIVFNTSMAGYQEVISDPSYTDQMITMTYPLIGNYGITDEDYESKQMGLKGFIVREYNDSPSNFRYTKTLSELLEENGVPGISEVDTRKITRIIRDKGSMVAMLCDADTPKETAVAEIRAYREPKDQVIKATCKKRWYSRTPNHKYTVVAVDCGIKAQLVKNLNLKGCNVTLVPYNATAAEIIKLNPDGVFFSNGPGDPTDVPETIQLVRDLRGRYPIMGVCLGHQIICLAYGAKTYKLKFGHRGGNHPIECLTDGRVEVTAQNHSYAVDAESLKGTGLHLTHINLLDNTVEGVESDDGSVFCVQFHPESAPGPCDSIRLFDKFIDNMEKRRNKNA